MARILLASLVALATAFMVDARSRAAEPDVPATGFTMTLAGKGTAAEAATSTEDIEEAWYRGGYYGRGGGWGGYRWGPYRNYLLFHPFRPFVNVRKAVFNPFYYGPGYYGGYGGYGGYGYGGYGYGGYGYGGYGGYCSYNGWGGGYGGYYGINGTQDDATAPAVSLNLAITKNPVARTVARTEAPAIPGTFSYDGGPTNPVPQVKPDAEPRAVGPAAKGLAVSLKKESASPYRYKAYGEK
jgi:hypothetical protein